MRGRGKTERKPDLQNHRKYPVLATRANLIKTRRTHVVEGQDSTLKTTKSTGSNN